MLRCEEAHLHESTSEQLKFGFHSATPPPTQTLAAHTNIYPKIHTYVHTFCALPRVKQPKQRRGSERMVKNWDSGFTLFCCGRNQSRGQDRTGRSRGEKTSSSSSDRVARLLVLS